MADEDRIVDKELISELYTIRNAYRSLSLGERESLVAGDRRTSAKALADFMEQLSPIRTTYGQIKELIKLYYATQHIPAAKRIFKKFSPYTKLFRSVSPPLAGLRPGNIHHIDEYLEEADKSNVQEASRAFFHDDTRLNRLGHALLSHVIKGNQDTVVAMLKRYPELLLYRGDTQDYSGREFKKVTALELTLWALDVRHMAPAMLNCLTDNEDHKDYSKELAPKLQQQFDNVVKEGEGVNYLIGCGFLKASQDPSQMSTTQRDASLNRRLNRHDGLIQYNDRLFYFHNLSHPKKLVEITDPEALDALKQLLVNKEKQVEVDELLIINNDEELKIIQKNVPNSQHIFREKHYDPTTLINTIDAHVQRYKTSTWSADYDHWSNDVGLAQYYIPANVAQHCCNPFGYSKGVPIPYTDQVLKRELYFYNLITRHQERWWPSSTNISHAGPELGLDFGILRANEKTSGYCGERGPDSQASVLSAGWMNAELESCALAALFKERTEADTLRLKQRLDKIQKPETGPEPDGGASLA